MTRRLRQPPCGAICGVTLIELMVTLAILAIVIGLAVPSFTRTLASNRMVTQTNDLTAGLKLARAEAIRRSQFVTLLSVDAGTPADFAKGWSVFTDADKNGVPGSTATDGTTLQSNRPATGRTVVHRVARAGAAPSFSYSNFGGADRAIIVFSARGTNANDAAAFFRVCDAGDSSIPGRIVQVSVVGNITLDSTTTVCP